MIEAATMIGMCDMGKKDIKRRNGAAELSDYLVRHITWCFQRNFPPREILKEHFAGVQTPYAANDVKDCTFVDEPIVAIMGDSEATVIFTPATLHGRVFVRHDSKVSITADTKVTVYAYDNAEVEIEATEDANVSVVLRGNAEVVNTQIDNVTIKKL